MSVAHDLLVRCATIVTVDAERRILENGWIAVDGDRIAAIGTGEPPKAKTVIDRPGLIALPGLIDAHSHAVSGALANNLMEYVGMSRFKTTEDVLDYLKQKTKDTPRGEWITGRNWDPAVQDGPEQLTTSILDHFK